MLQKNIYKNIIASSFTKLFRIDFTPFATVQNIQSQDKATIYKSVFMICRGPWSTHHVTALLVKINSRKRVFVSG